MPLALSRRLFLLQLFLLTACEVKSVSSQGGKLVIGVVGYDQAEDILKRYANFTTYLSKKLKVFIELEPTFNENKALERIRKRAWSLVFAPPGLAAIAIANEKYRPLFPLRGIDNLRSILVVRKNSPIQNLKELQGKTVALSQPGSATGYYLPIYNLYGLTLADILLAPTPKTVLEWIIQEKASAGALSIKEFELYSLQNSEAELRVLHTDIHPVPPGVVLINSTIDMKTQVQIRQAMNDVSPILAQEAGYIPNGPVPDYQYMISVVERVSSLSANIHEKPAYLF